VWGGGGGGWGGGRGGRGGGGGGGGEGEIVNASAGLTFNPANLLVQAFDGSVEAASDYFARFQQQAS